MNRRLIGLACACALLGGCDLLKHETRSKSDIPIREESDESNSGDSPSAGFFKSSRLSGAMSSEGREVERDLGIH